MNSYAVNLLSNATATGNGMVYPGGKSAMTVIAGGSGTAKLQMLGPDGSTWVDVPNASLTATGMVLGLDLPQGTYRGNVATLTGVYMTVSRAG